MNLHLANSNLKDPEFYVPGLPVDWVTARYGIPADEVAKLGSAENPFGPSPKAMAAIREEVEQIHLYSSWTAEPLREALAERYGYNSENFVCGSGETEVIALVIRAFADVATWSSSKCKSLLTYRAMSIQIQKRRSINGLNEQKNKSSCQKLKTRFSVGKNF